MKPIRLIQYAWVVEVAVLVAVGVSLVYFLPDRIAGYISMLPLLTTMIIAQGSAAFAGPQWKKHLEIKKDRP